MEKKDFEQHIGKPVTAAVGDNRSVTLELTRVEEREKRGDPGRDEPFSLILKGPKDQHLPDNTYEMTLGDGTRQHIFISAHDFDDTGSILYDAVFT